MATSNRSSLGLVCRPAADFRLRSGGRISSGRGWMGAAVVVRSMLGVSPSSLSGSLLRDGTGKCRDRHGVYLGRGGHINSAGGYLRDLTRQTCDGSLRLVPC
ncbi:replication initiation protein RepC [Rhizobium beringeri]